MRFLGIETSCDETAVGIVEDRGSQGPKILANIVASQQAVHAPYGGVVPDLAARHHIENLVPVLETALKESNLVLSDIDGIAATYAPGLVVSLLTGLSFGKSLAFARGLPFIGVNHLEAHLHSARLVDPVLQYPYLGLVVSGGHTSLYLVRDFGNYQLLGHTRDDAAGEAYDKVARMLGLGYPGGPILDRLAQQGNPKAFPLTIPKMAPGTFDFSFSGFKTAIWHLVQGRTCTQNFTDDIAASFQEAVTSFLLRRLDEAAEKHKIENFVITGGVAANQGLRLKLKILSEIKGYRFSIPPLPLCTDNGAMVAYLGLQGFQNGRHSGWDLNAVANEEIGF